MSYSSVVNGGAVHIVVQIGRVGLGLVIDTYRGMIVKGAGQSRQVRDIASSLGAPIHTPTTGLR